MEFYHIEDFESETGDDIWEEQWTEVPATPMDLYGAGFISDSELDVALMMAQEGEPSPAPPMVWLEAA